MNCVVIFGLFIFGLRTRARAGNPHRLPSVALICVARYVIIWLCVAEHMHMYLYMGHELCCCLVYLSLDFVHARGQALRTDYHR